MDIAFPIAEAARSTTYDVLPAPVVAVTKAFILDTLGAAIAGSSAEGIDEGLHYVRDNGGAPQATIMVFGDRLPATAAAMINGTMCQARDFDPVYEPGVLLPYGPVIAAALAIGEMTGASGREFVNAVVVGADLTCRLGRALTSGLGWSRTATLGVFGAALASARLLELDREQTVCALGLALSQSSGNIQTVIDGTLAKRYQAGFSAESGVKAALLAKRGITGPTNVFEGRCGFFKLYESGSYHRALVTEGLGTQFEGANSSIKPFPCAREHHGAVAAALQLFSEGVRSNDIESVVVRLPPNAFALSGRRFSRSESHTVAAAMGSAAYGVAVALTKGALTLDDFQQEALLRADVVELADRIQIEEDRTVTDAKTLVPQVVVVRRRGVTRIEEAISHTMPGSPEHPLTTDELERKLVGCFAYSAHPSRPQAREGLIVAIENLESMTNIRELAALTA